MFHPFPWCVALQKIPSNLNGCKTIPPLDAS
jgi:hypothetical protein